MKVLLFSSGFTEYIIELANALAQKEQVTSIALMGPQQLFSQRYSSLIDSKVIQMPVDFVDYVSFRQNLKMTQLYIKKINEYKPDIFHLQANGRHPWFAFIIPFLKKCKIINTIHDPEYHVGDKLSRIRNMAFARWVAKQYTKKYIVHGVSLKQKLKESYKIAEKKIAVVPHGHLNMYTEWQREKQKEEPSTILFFGRIWEYKGLKYLIQAEPYMSKEVKDIKIIIAGTGEELEIYEEYFDDKSKFEILNYKIPAEEVANLFDRSAVVVLPYIEATQSGVIPVAYALGKPVVASNVGALPEVVVNGETGILVEPRDPERLAKEVVYLLKNEGKRKEMGDKAKAFAFDQLSWDSIADKTLIIYKEALA